MRPARSWWCRSDATEAGCSGWHLAAELAACAGALELAAAGYGDDVEVSGQLDVSRVVPVLRGDAFVDAGCVTP